MAKNRSAPTIQEIRAREEARRQARKRKPKVEHKQDMETYSLIIHLPEGADKANAYRGLQRADCLVPKFRYHEHLQLACMRGQVIFPEMLKVDAFNLLSTLKEFGWRQGYGKDGAK
jgi:hypothetical protein